MRQSTTTGTYLLAVWLSRIQFPCSPVKNFAEDRYTFSSTRSTFYSFLGYYATDIYRIYNNHRFWYG